jgi:hypothetical protein
MAASPLVPFAWIEAELTLTRCIEPFASVATKTSCALLLSPRTRLEAKLSNATYRASGDIEGVRLFPFAWAPFESTLTRRIVALWRSKTNTSRQHVSPGTRVFAALSNAT